MIRKRVFLALLFAVCVLARVKLAVADESTRHKLLFAEYGQGPNRLCEVDADGKLTWEHKLPSVSVIFQRLPRGNVLYAYGGSPTGVQEVDRDHKIVWDYKSSCPQVLGCERLANGNTLVAEQGPCQVVEVDPAGKVVRTIKLSTSEEHFHRQVRNVHLLPGGNILAGHEGEGAVREVDPTGKVVWEIKNIDNAPDAIRLPGGNTLVACGTQARVIEVTPENKIVWEFGKSDAPELNLVWVASLQVLKNGNYLIGNFLRGHEGQGVHACEVTKDKKVVWKYDDHKLVKSLATIRAIE